MALVHYCVDMVIPLSMSHKLRGIVYHPQSMRHRLWMNNLPASNRLTNIASLNMSVRHWTLSDLLLKQRKLFPYIFIAMSLLGALPAIYFAGSHKRRTQEMRFSNDSDVNHKLYSIIYALSSIITDFVWESSKDQCSFVMSGLEETLTETLSGLFEFLLRFLPMMLVTCWWWRHF